MKGRIPGSATNQEEVGRIWLISDLTITCMLHFLLLFWIHVEWAIPFNDITMHK